MINLTILTPEREIYRGKVQSITVPGVSGKFQVLENHAPIVSALEAGEISVVTAVGENQYYDQESGSIKMTAEPGKTLHFQISGGFIEVLQNTIAVLLHTAKEA